MREIKYRARNKATSNIYDVTAILFSSNGSDIIRVSKDYGCNEYMSNEVDLLQYTGFMDKNGVEIYEEDILLYTKDSGGTVNERELRVTWSEVDGAFNNLRTRILPLLSFATVVR